jgi:hypothetical protein
MTQVLAVGAVVAVSLGTGALVGSAAPTSLYASTAVQPAVAVRPAVAPVAPRTAQIRRAAQAPVAQAVAAAEFNADLMPVAQPQQIQGLSLVQLLLIPASALVAGFAAYLWKSESTIAMAATTGEAEAEEDTTALVGKNYKSGSRADSYYGKPVEGATGKMAEPMKSSYKAPEAFKATSDKSYTPTSDPSKSFYGSGGATSTAAKTTYAPPKNGYSAQNNKTYKPTTAKVGSYLGGETNNPLGSMWYGADRPKWLGPYTTDKSVPAYLTGELPGDYGWDSAGLGADPEQLERYREAEIVHGRWAMLGALGCLLPEAMAKYGGYEVGEPVWFKAGAYIFDHCGVDISSTTSGGQMQSIFGHANSGDNIPLSPVFIFICQIIFMGLGEGFRSSQITGRDKVYPGKFFDPMGLADDPNDGQELKVKEVKNGRLAMLAMVGFYAQACVTKQGPVENWAAHVADPFHVNLFSQFLGQP